MDLFLFLQRFEKLGLLMQLNQILLKRKKILLHSFTLTLSSVSLLGKTSSIQDISPSNTSQREQRKYPICIIFDLREEFHLLRLREVLDEEQVPQ